MVFAARDYYESGNPPPNDTTNPAENSFLYNYLVRRLFDSFNLLRTPSGPSRYYHLMNPALPDHETELSKIGITPHGRAWVMIREEWPKIKSDIDNSKLSPLGLIQVKSLDPFQMGDNHQVLAYRYDLNGDDLDIFLYDPNKENDDNVRISLNIGNPEHTTQVSRSPAGAPVYCFFHVHYDFSFPPISPTSGVGRMWHTIRYWHSWNAFGDVKEQAGDPGTFVDVDSGIVAGLLHVVGITGDGRMWHTIRFADRWQPFGDVKNASSDPGAFTKLTCAGVIQWFDLHVVGIT
jgi:hypothetical protein